MTLTHPGKTAEPLAFKVKTTQPRRYLVRPNQGVITAGSSETIALILVDKDKQTLLQSYERLGQSALDHSKDKFLVQSCNVPPDLASQFVKNPDGTTGKNPKEFSDALTSMWNRAMNNREVPVQNKKLHVKHIVLDGSRSPGAMPQETTGSTSVSPSATPFQGTLSLQNAEKRPLESMTQEQMITEVGNLRRKYDELVAFSVNLTAERDILNNTLEQTKRDLSREMTSRSALENNGGKERVLGTNRGKGFSLSLIQSLVLALACYVAGLKTGDRVMTRLEDSPMFSSVLEKIAVVETSPVVEKEE